MKCAFKWNNMFPDPTYKSSACWQLIFLTVVLERRGLFVKVYTSERNGMVTFWDTSS